MKLGNQVREETHNGEPGIVLESNPVRMRIIIVFTTIEGTLAALHAAANFAKGLYVEIVLIATEVVPFRYPLEHPPVGAYFFERLCLALINESNLNANAVGFEIHFCREQMQCLHLMLRPCSLVVIGAKERRWPSRERKMWRVLSRLGHDVVLIRSSSTFLKSCAKSIIQDLLEDNEVK